ISAMGGLSVGPLSVRMEVPAGEADTAALTIQNTGEEPIDVILSLHDWWRTPQGDLQILPPESLDRSCAPWLLFSPTFLSLQSGESGVVTLELAVPEEVDGEKVEGDHWALLLVEEKPQPVAEEEAEGLTGKTQVVISYAIKILQQDAATQNKAAQITGIELAKESPLLFVITYENVGNAHLQTSGVAQVIDIYGETIREFEIALFPTLPGERRALQLKDEEGEPLPTGQYFLSVVLDFGEEYLIQGGLPFEISAGSPSSEH
ncbi:hypothetical protein KAX17_16330, partial [Candidatus Bipolaricaulota bacterium]|nr:hypothetical protein [Candidatus Bipolaricaulota bacterium]